MRFSHNYEELFAFLIETASYLDKDFRYDLLMIVLISGEIAFKDQTEVNTQLLYNKLAHYQSHEQSKSRYIAIYFLFLLVYSKNPAFEKRLYLHICQEINAIHVFCQHYFRISLLVKESEKLSSCFESPRRRKRKLRYYCRNLVK